MVKAEVRENMKEKAPLNVQIGKRIRQIRKDRKLTQEELSFKLAIDVQTMSNIERGVTGIKTITLIAFAENSPSPATPLFSGNEAGMRPATWPGGCAG